MTLRLDNALFRLSPKLHGANASNCTRPLALLSTKPCAGVAELVDAPDLGSGAERRGVQVPPPAPYVVRTNLTGGVSAMRKK